MSLQAHLEEALGKVTEIDDLNMSMKLEEAILSDHATTKPAKKD